MTDASFTKMFPSCFKMISPFAGKEVQAKIVKALSADKLVVTPGHSGVVTLLQPSVAKSQHLTKNYSNVLLADWRTYDWSSVGNKGTKLPMDRRK